MNLYDNDWDVERSYGDARMRMMHVGRKLGSELLGATVFEIEPGIPGLYHFHHGNEEWALVLDGTLTLRTPEGERELQRGDVAVFRRGPGGRARAREQVGLEYAGWPCSPACVEPDVVAVPRAGVLGAIAGDAPTAGRDAPFEAFFRASCRPARLRRHHAGHRERSSAGARAGSARRGPRTPRPAAWCGGCRSAPRSIRSIRARTSSRPASRSTTTCADSAGKPDVTVHTCRSCTSTT